MARISELASRLAALEQQDRESQAKTQATLASIKATIAELEALEFTES